MLICYAQEMFQKWNILDQKWPEIWTNQDTGVWNAKSSWNNNL